MDKQIPRQEIFLAAEHGNVKGLTILEKDFGIECLKIMDDEGFTLMSYAAANGHESVIRYLIQKGLDCSAPNLYGWSPLMQAAYYGWLPAVGRLLDSGARVNDVNNLGATALLCACKNGYYSIAEMLIKQGAEVNVSENNNCGFTPLMAACQSGNEQMVRLLLTHGADPNAKLKGSGWTALMLASLNNHKEVVKILLANGADKECANACGKNALIICCEVENNEIATLLHGGKPYKMEKKRASSTKKGGTKVDLFEASKQGNIVAVNELITADEQAVHAVDKDGATPLMFAAMRGHTEVCKALINGGSKIDAQDYRSGWTAFMQAIHHRQHAIAKLLIEYGADVNLRATNGCGAFEVATFNGDTEMMQLIASTALGKKSKPVTDDKGEKGRSRKVSLQEKRSRLKAVKTIEDDADLIFESPGKPKEPEFPLKKHQSEMEMSQPLVKTHHHSCSMEVSDEQMVPAPPDFSVSPSPSVLLDRVRKALNTEVPKPSEAAEVSVQRFPSSRQHQQAKGLVDSDHSPPSQRTAKPAESQPCNPPIAKEELTNQNPPVADKPIRSAVDSSPLVRRTVAPNHVAPVAVESDWSPPVKRSDLSNHIPQSVPTAFDPPKQSAPPMITNSFQKFLMKKTAQAPDRGGAPDHARNSQDSVDSSPKPTRSPLVTDIGSSSPKQTGLSKELPPSILNRIAKNVRGKPNRSQYGNIASSGDLLANLAMKYGKQPVGGAMRVQDPIPTKPQPVKPVPPPVSTDQVITEDSDLADVLRQFSLERFIPVFEEHEVDMATFLSMTNTDLEEVGITDAEEKLNILDAIVEIKDRTPASLSGGKKAVSRNIPSSFAYQNLHQWS